MKADIDSLMRSQGVDAILVTGPAQHNPMMIYFTGVVHVTDADLIKIRGQQPVLFVPPMEREEGARSGLQTVSNSKYPLTDFLSEAGGDMLEAHALRYEKLFCELGLISGRVALYGLKDAGFAHAVFSRLQKRLPDLILTGFARDKLLLQAMMTKDEDEVDHIRRMGKITTDVVGRTADFLCSHKAKNDQLVHPDGSPLTIGEVKRKINLWLAEAGAENPEGTIFSIGRDAALPHSTGKDTDTLRLGQPIVFDIFPCEEGGGYFYDFTRTWCLGHAPEEVIKLHEDVRSVYQTVVSKLEVGQPFWRAQQMTCELFESMGHTTVLNNPVTESGYVHSLGHGLGLQIHEKPFASLSTHTDTDILAPGSVFSIEPGLYYPEKGMGVRIEDTWLAKADGTFEMLADYPTDLVLPIK